MYFVDSGQTRSVTVRTTHAKAIAAGLVAVGAMAAGMTSLAISLFGELIATQSLVKELKATSLAAAIVHENLMTEAPTLLASQEPVVLHGRTREIQQALLAGKPARAEGRDAEPKDEPKDETQHDPREELVQTAAPVPKPEQPEQPEKAGPAAPPPPSTPDVALAAAPMPEPQIQDVTFTNIKSRYSSASSTLTLSFDLKKQAHDNKVAEGRFCVTLRGKDAQGQDVVLRYPDQPGRADKHPKAKDLPCKKGFPVRFARFRPSRLDFTTPELSLGSAELIFVSKGRTMTHRHDFTN
jgi:hypothetical protein